MKLEPITCEHITRNPNMNEIRSAGNNMMYEVRIDFHFWNGDEWVQYGLGGVVVLTKPMTKIIAEYSKQMEKQCWNWLSKALKKGEITHGECLEKKTSKILAIAKHPIIFMEES